MDLSTSRKVRRPQRIEDLLSVCLTSGGIVDPAKIGLNAIRESQFLTELAHGLDAEVAKGIDIANRLGWILGQGLWRLGRMYRVYFVPAHERRPDEHEPDEFHHGIAPSVKLLIAVVSALKEIDVGTASNFIKQWKSLQTPLHVRLWAASARDTRIAAHAEVGAFLRDCDDRQFWQPHYYPEITELRACRFQGLNERDQRAVLSRLRKKPPRNLWPKEVDPERVREAHLYWAAQELRRIEIIGTQLPDDQRVWLASRLNASINLRSMTRPDEGFPGMSRAQWVQPNPDDRYDLLDGGNRLRALEAALSSGQRGWDDNPAERAWDWIRADDHVAHLLDDLESTADAGASYPKVWDHLGKASAAPLVVNGKTDNKESDVAAETRLRRVLALLERLSDEMLRAAIEGITQLLATWQLPVVAIDANARVWFRLWPIAVTATNDQAPTEAEPDLNVVARGSDDHEPMDLDTLNTPVGRLVGVFLTACPKAGPGDRPFDANTVLRAMRDAAVSAPGRSGLIARHRMIEALHWFLAADPQWSRDQLLVPLRGDTNEALALWRAVARQTQFTEVLRVIGDMAAERAADGRLGRETRRSLVFSLVIESLHAFREVGEPAIPRARVQQMLRSLDDEVRAHAAGTVQRFVTALSAQAEGPTLPLSPGELFHLAAEPFLRQVWPQERSLTTPGIASAFADLPAASGEAFAAAVGAIERFLVPFGCWSMADFGFHGTGDDRSGLSQINNERKAKALLRLLDHTIGAAEDAVVPYDLGRALDQMEQIAPQLAQTQKFRRLAALTRK